MVLETLLLASACAEGTGLRTWGHNLSGDSSGSGKDDREDLCGGGVSHLENAARLGVRPAVHQPGFLALVASLEALAALHW